MQQKVFTIILLILFAQLSHAQYDLEADYIIDESKLRFTLTKDDTYKFGVIDRLSNKIVLQPKYEYAMFYSLNDYTLVEVHRDYTNRWRFWEWDFLPGFSVTGGTGDNRLFDTKVPRRKKTLYLLSDKQPRKIWSSRETIGRFHHFNVRPMDNNQVLINDRLYQISDKGSRLISKNVKDQLTTDTYAYEKNKRLHIIDRQGKRIDKKVYQSIDSLTFKVSSGELTVNLVKFSPRLIAPAYQFDNGNIYIFPDFKKTLPLHIKPNQHKGDLTTEELIEGVWLITTVPNTDFFVFLSFRNGERFYRLLDTQGNWHLTLPDTIDFEIVLPTGHVIWPPKQNSK